MNKRIRRGAAALGIATAGTVLLAGPALALLPVPPGHFNAHIVMTAQAARVQSDLEDLWGGDSVLVASPSPGRSPADLPYLQLGLGAVVVASIVAGTTVRVRRHHGPQPV